MENLLNILMFIAILGVFAIVVGGSMYFLNKYNSRITFIVADDPFVDRDQFNGGPDPCSHSIDNIEKISISGIGKNLFSEK